MFSLSEDKQSDVIEALNSFNSCLPFRTSVK